MGSIAEKPEAPLELSSAPVLLKKYHDKYGASRKIGHYISCWQWISLTGAWKS